jgi:pSer/pThr/pTyr-binding forkhead associated (FHA) protein
MNQDNDAYEGELERPGLIWQRGEEQDVEFAVWPERPVTIGRDPTNTIAVESPFVSKAHAIFQFANGQYVIEDLQSANGTRVNGAPIESAVVEPGDVIEIGDQRFLFIDRSARKAGGGSKGLGKNAKLALVALGTFVVMGGLMMLLVAGGGSGAKAPVPAPAAGGTAAAQAPREAPAPAQTQADSEQVREVIARAEKAGVTPVDALLDEAMLQYRGGRLRDAVQMLTAVQARAPQHPVAGQRLAEIRRELEQAIADHSGQAARAFSQLRYDDAVNEWEQVLLLADSSDSRYRDAQDGINRARQRGAR